MAQLYNKCVRKEATRSKEPNPGKWERLSRKTSLLKGTISVSPKVEFGIVRKDFPFQGHSIGFGKKSGTVRRRGGGEMALFRDSICYLQRKPENLDELSFFTDSLH
jgi:hypothetical protein